MQSFPKSRWLMSCGALLTLMSVSCGPASADKFELVYRATLNEGSAPLSGFIGPKPFPVGTPLTITADFDTSSADQWNTGAYTYTAISLTFLIGSTAELYEAEPGALSILLSDPSWAAVGGPAPYSAGFFRTFPGGAINSVFGSSTAPFQAGDPSPTIFYDYQNNFNFAERGPLTVLLSGGQLTLYDNSVFDVTAAIFPVPELSTPAMMAFGFAGLGMARRLREWRTESRARRLRNGVGRRALPLAIVDGQECFATGGIRAGGLAALVFNIVSVKQEIRTGRMPPATAPVSPLRQLRSSRLRRQAVAGL